MPIGSTRPVPIPATAAQWYFREQKLEFLKKDALAVVYYSCLLKWWTPAGGNMRIRDFFGVFLDLLDTSTE